MQLLTCPVFLSLAVLHCLLLAQHMVAAFRAVLGWTILPLIGLN